MRSRFLTLLLVSLFSFSLEIESLWALTYPTSTPVGETTWGTYRTYFDNLFFWWAPWCPVGDVIRGFTSTGVPDCISPVSSGLFLSGQTLWDTIYFDGTDWIRNNNIFNAGGNIGIGTQTPWAKLEINGQIKITGGGFASGRILTSDNNWLAYWSNVAPNVTASGIIWGTQNYVPRYGLGWSGLVLSQIYDDGTNIGIGTATPSTSVKLDVIWDILVNSLRLGRGGGNIISNTVFWWNALNVNVTGTTNVAIGYGAYSSLTLWDGNIGIGNLAGSTQTSGSNNLFIGNNTQPNISTTASNQLNIGNWIYGNSGSIGIGVLNPAAKLDINGTLKIWWWSPGLGKFLTSDATGIASWTWLITATSLNITGQALGTTLYYNGTSWIASTNIYNTWWAVGIGTATPWAKLEINGQIKITGWSPWIGKVLVSDASGLANWQSGVPASTVDATNITGWVPNYITKFWSGGVGIFQSLFYETGWLIGLGNTNPGVELDITGQVRIRGGSPGAWRVLTSDATGIASWVNPSVATSVYATGVLAMSSSGWYITKFMPSGSGITSSNMFESGTNIGINNINPGYTLDVSGTGNFIWLRLPTGSAAGRILTSDSTGNALWSGGFSGSTTSSGITWGTQNYITKFGTGGNGIYVSQVYDSWTGVGIATTSPSTALDVNGQIRLRTGAGNGLYLISDTNWVWSWTWAVTATSLNIVWAALGTTLYYNGTSWVASTIIYNTWWAVGIGTATPLAKLDVNGSGRIVWDLTVQWRLITDTIVNRTVNNVSISGSLLPDAWAPTIYRDIWSVALPWTNLYLSNQIRIAWWSPWLGKILMSDAVGLATWTTYASGATATGITGWSSGYLSVFWAWWNGLYASLLFQTGSRIGIGNSNPGYTLDVTGTGSFDGFQLPTGAWAGRVLTSDASGNASWSSSISWSTATGITGWVANYVTKFGTGWNGIYPSQIFDNWVNIGVWTWSNLSTKFVIDSGIANDSGLQFSRLTSASPVTSNGIITIGVNGSGKVVGISPVSNIAVYTWVLRTTALTPNPNLNNFEVTYDFNRYFGIPGKQSFVVSKGDGPSYNGPYFKENGTDALCSITGTYGSPWVYDCADPDPATGISASPANSFTMSAKWDTFGYQLALGARGDAPLFARSGRFNGSQTWGLYTNDSPYQTPAPWQRVISVPANHPEYLYINTGLNSQLQAITGWGNVAIGTTTPTSRFEVWTWASTESLLHFRGTNNVWLGLAALNSSVSGQSNTAVGANSLDVISSGWGNVGIGFRAWANITTGSNNIMIWSWTSANSATASNQLNIGNWVYGTGGYIAIGTATPTSRFEVWDAPTISLLHFRGSNNTAFWSGAVRTALSGNANSGFWAESLFSLTSWYSNSAFGYRAMRITAAGFNNTAIGQEALYNNGGWSWNSSVWYQALYSNSSGTGNIAMGPQALYNLSTGNQNIAIGYQALRAVGGSAVNNNIGIGYNALYATTASNLVAIGFWALNSNTSGTQNTAIWYSTLDAVTTTGNNTAIWYSALWSTTWWANTALGTNAWSNLTTGSGNIIIGSDIQSVSNTANNQLNIGNWIYGSGGDIGIWASSPTAKLDVAGTFKLGTAGTVTTAAGTCTIGSTAITTTATAYTCTGVPASTSVAVNCSAAAAFTTAGTTSLYCRANGSANSVTCNTTVANSVATTYKCMWMQ